MTKEEFVARWKAAQREVRAREGAKRRKSNRLMTSYVIERSGRTRRR